MGASPPVPARPSRYLNPLTKRVFPVRNSNRSSYVQEHTNVEPSERGREKEKVLKHAFEFCKYDVLYASLRYRTWKRNVHIPIEQDHIHLRAHRSMKRRDLFARFRISRFSAAMQGVFGVNEFFPQLGYRLSVCSYLRSLLQYRRTSSETMNCVRENNCDRK